MSKFKDKSFLVTGASSGIGRALSQDIAAKGGRVVLIGRNKEKLNETVASMKNPEIHIAISYDLTDFEHYMDIFGRLKRESIRLDGLVHCAGFTEILPLRIMNQNNVLKLFNIHYFAFIELVKYYARKGVSNGGSVVGISAINVHTPQKCMTAYASAKSAVEAACKTLALELNSKNIRINSVVVGGVSTNMSEKASELISSIETSYENPVSRQLLGIQSPNQIADVISFMLSDESSCITGRTIYADGGLL